jgi:hypothetical protein
MSVIRRRIFNAIVRMAIMPLVRQGPVPHERPSNRRRLAALKSRDPKDLMRRLEIVAISRGITLTNLLWKAFQRPLGLRCASYRRSVSVSSRLHQRWCLLLLLLVTALGSPFASFAQTYTSLIGGVVLGSDGFSYQPSGRFGSMYPPGQTVPMSQIVFGVGSCGNGNSCSQEIGLGKQDGFAYLVAWQNTSNAWQLGGILPGQQTRFSQLTAHAGWGNNGGFWNGGGGFTTVYKNNFLQVIGLGADDGLAYLAAFQDQGGTWHSAGKLPGQTVPFAQLYVVPGNSGKLQVIGRAVSDNRLYLTVYQDNNGNWVAGGLLPGQSPSSSSILVANPGELQVLSLGADGYVYLSNWQDTSGTWHAAGILPGQSAPLEKMTAVIATAGDSNSGYYNQLQVGGLGASDHILRMTNWQDIHSTWNAYDASSPPGPGQILQVPVGQVDGFYGIGKYDNHVYVLLNESYAGVWSSGYDETPTRVAPRPWLPVINFLLQN